MAIGFVRLRKDLPGWLLDDATKLKWYIDLLMLSAERDKGGIRKGQVTRTMHSLAKKWGVSVPLVSRFLKALDQQDLIILVKSDSQQMLQKALQQPLQIFVRDFNELRENALQKALQQPLQRESRKDDNFEGSERYVKFIKYLEVNTPYCYKNMTLPTEVEFYTLVEQYGARMVADIVKQIENRKDLRKTYTNLYMTMTNWLKNEMKRNNGTAI